MDCSYHVIFFEGSDVVCQGNDDDFSGRYRKEYCHFCFQWLALCGFLITKSASPWSCPDYSLFCSVSRVP